MGWSIGFCSITNRDIGYGVPAYCDAPGCDAEIDRGMGYKCLSSFQKTCNMFFCSEHRVLGLCRPCRTQHYPYEAKPDHPRWIKHKLTDSSWAEWRDANPHEVKRLKEIKK
jgi:hypothetical protein